MTSAKFPDHHIEYMMHASIHYLICDVQQTFSNHGHVSNGKEQNFEEICFQLLNATRP